MWEEQDEGGKLGLAVSGGPDSLALLLLAHAAMPGRIEAASVDHGLRPESAAEAALVVEVCGQLSIPCSALRVQVQRGNVQDRARDARYEALCRHFGARGIDTLATAHHADDQGETVLMRLNRGSGLSGLAGIRARSPRFTLDPPGEYLVVRPLLHWRRDELGSIVADSGLTPVRDPSNEDEAFDRVQVRKALANWPWLDPLAIATSAQNLQDAEPVIENEVAKVWQRFVYHEGDRASPDVSWLHFGHPRAVEIDVVKMILAGFGADVRRSSIARMVDLLYTGKVASLGGVVARRAWHQADPLTQSDAWKFEREPPRKTG